METEGQCITHSLTHSLILILLILILILILILLILILAHSTALGPRKALSGQGEATGHELSPQDSGKPLQDKRQNATVACTMVAPTNNDSRGKGDRKYGVTIKTTI